MKKGGVISVEISHYLVRAADSTGPAARCAMNERTIFLGALEREDPAARAAYLDRACAGQPALRQRVEELLRSHQEADAFLTESAMEQLQAAEQSLAFLGPPREPGSLGRLDHYDVLEVVGRGGTGLVLKARDTKLQRVVAIKVLAPRLAASGTARARFVREAQAAAAVRDDHVVAIHAVSHEGPVAYLVMEYIHGITLEEQVKQAGALELKETLRIGMQVANGLAAAHAQGVVHRDIKPANILLENHVQRVKITDFGLARAAEDAAPAPGRVLAGTPLFMSPEQARGEPTDHRTDLFSLGSVLYTLCTGRSPFRADTTAAVLHSVAEVTAPPLRWVNPNVPDWLCDLIGRLHAREADRRLASAREVADVLGGQLALLQGPPRTPPPAGKAVAPSRRRWLVAAICLAALLVALGAVAAWLKPWQGAAPEVQPDPGDRPGDAAPEGRRRPAEPLDLRCETIPPRLLTLAGGGDPAKAPPELAAVLGDGRFLLPHVGATAWMEESPDGKLLAVPLDEDVVLFEAPAGTYLRSLKGPGGRVVWVTFSRDSQLLAATTWHEGLDGALRVWEVRTGKERFTKPVPGPKVSGATAFSADGRRLVGEGSARLHVWDARSGEETQTVTVVPGGCGRVCFSPDGRHLAAALWQGRGVKVFDWDGERLAASSTLQGHSEGVMTVAYSPDGKVLASGTDKEFKLWEAQSLREIRTVSTPAQELAFSPDGRTLFASAGIAKMSSVHTWTRWEVGTQNELPALSVEVAVEPAHAWHCLSRDLRLLFLAPGGPHATCVRAIDTVSGKEVFPRRQHLAPLNAVAVGPDGRTLASAGEDRVIKVWDLADGRVLHSLAAHAGAVWGLAFSPDGTLLASGSRDGTIALWDVGSGSQVRALRGHSRVESRLRFSPDGRTLAAGGDSSGVNLWDVATGERRAPLAGHAGAVRCVAFSPDGTRLASGGEDGTVRLHNLAAGSSQRLTAPQGVNDLAFSPDGHTLAAVTDAPEAAVCLWNLETGEQTTGHGHAGKVQGVAFTPAGPLLATCGEDGTIRLWDRAARRPVRTIGPGPFGGPVRAVAFTPDGRYLLTANANGTVYVLRVGTTP
jgi:WD40 repeat protein/tRNA A-37 threonylcarbamoyl transferase component Bud32